MADQRGAQTRQSKKVRKRVQDLYRKCIHLISGPMILSVNYPIHYPVIVWRAVPPHHFFPPKKSLKTKEGTCSIPLTLTDGSAVKGMARSCAYNSHKLSRGSVAELLQHLNRNLITVVGLFVHFQLCLLNLIKPQAHGQAD